jgi:hypothetical protein
MSDPILVRTLAEALARLPGRLEVDKEEAERIGVDLWERRQRGEFSAEEIVAQFVRPDDPPDAPRTWRPLADLDADICLGEWWYGSVALTRPAARRYVVNCGLAGAPRVFVEWFGSRLPRDGNDPKARRAAPYERIGETFEAAAATGGHSAGEPCSASPGPKPPVPSGPADRLAEWIFARRARRLTCKALYEEARRDPVLGTFRKAQFLEAFGSVYETQPHRPPATGWPLCSPYKERHDREKPPE